MITKVEPGVVSTDAVETEIAYSPDGNVRLLARSEGQWGENGRGAIYESRLANGKWSEFVVAAFSGAHSDSDPFFSPDGKFVYFTSDRGEGNDAANDRNIWRIAVVEDGYGAAEILPAPINSPADEYSSTLNGDGDLYFASMRAGGYGLGDLYVARSSNGRFLDPENLGPTINGKGGEWTVVTSPDDKLLIFEASHRAENKGGVSGDLYGALKSGGGWESVRNLRLLNTEGSDLGARFSLDGSGIFYASTHKKGGAQADIMQAPKALVLSHFSRIAAVSRSAHQVCVFTVPGFIESGCAKTGDVGPHEIAASPDGRFAYVPNHGVYPQPHDEPIEPDQLKWVNGSSQSISKIDLTMVKTVGEFQLEDCQQPHGVAVSHDGASIWVTCENDQSVQHIDAVTGERLRTINIGVAGVHEIKMSPRGNLLATANFDHGSISLISLDDDLSVDTIETGRGAEGMRFSSDGASLYVSNAFARTVSVIDVNERRRIRDIPTGGQFSIDLFVSETRDEIWVTHTASRDITVIDMESGEIKTKIALNSTPLGIIMSPDEKYAFVTMPRLNQVWAYDVETYEIIEKIDGVMEGDGLAWIPQVVN
ncbi:hypothetical protein PUV54_09285 [Hyphococcus flavus]|uniref:YNCE-like beta-propeller domain-containing protein n=1 Tax=Hyphococcus flavus TaxID=1866326 RepID=A0AAE9ZAK0_9PROT|nr:hypothetical protein [Hyphococcus flavus]WDI30151.1 hypothetical protein PUV54_09285 [Hyphococcus flavus]